MKYLVTAALLLIGVCVAKAQVSGTFTVGPGADYENLPAAITGINNAGGMNGDVILELQSNYAVTDYTTLSNAIGNASYSVTIRPAADVTDLQINHDFRFNGNDNVVFDGANPSSGNKVVQINGEIRMYSSVRNVTFSNLKINLQGQFGIYGSNSGGASGTPYWDDITITGCEFFAASPIDFGSTVYAIYSYPNTSPQSAWPTNIVVQNNKFYGINRTNTVGNVTCMFVRSGLKAYNNSLNHVFSGNESRFNGIFSSYGSNEAINNTINVSGGDTSTDAYITAISFSSAQTGGKVFNNIVNITSSGSAATDKRGISVNTLHTFGYNNIYVYDDGVSDAYFHGSNDLEGSLSYSSTMTYSEASFTDPSTGDLSLTGSSLTNPDFRSTYTSSLTTDHNGDAKHSTVPSKGAFEAENMIADITSFNHANKYVDAVIDDTNSTVLLEVTNGTDLSSLGPTIGTYHGATISPTSGTARDFNTPLEYTVTAEDGSTMDTWTATIVHQNDAPTDILMTSTNIDENSNLNTVVGTFSSEDVDADSHSYDLVAGTGDTDNGSFLINGSALELNTSLDYETKKTYSIRVRTDDNVAHGGTFEKEFIIAVNDLPDEAPTAIYLDSDQVVEGAPIGTAVATLSTEDVDVVDDHAYTLVSGTGDSGNDFFDIVDDQLVTATSFDFADGASYSVLIRTTDNGAATYDQAFTINIKEVNDGPQGSAASSEIKITPSTRYSYNYFGEDIAISDGYAFVGAREHDYDENEENFVLNAGAAYVFEKDEMGGWTQTQKLVRPSNRSNYDNFGELIAMDGNYAAIGMDSETGTSTGFTDGIVLMYEKNESGTWEYKQELTPSGSNDDGIDFGYSIDISGDYLVASALYDGYDENGANYVSDAGAAYIFKRNASGVWEEVQKIVASDRETYGYYYGESVAITDGYIAIGATEANSLAEDGMTLLEQTGAIYMYEEDESGHWSEVAKLVASDRIEYEYLGYYIDLDGETLIIGNNEKEVEGVGWAGQVYVFERLEGVWTETEILTSDLPVEDGEFGRSVSISGDNIAIGSYYADPDGNGGGAYIFSKSGNNWIQSDMVRPSFIDDDFGRIVAIDGQDLIVADSYAELDANDENHLTNSGAAYYFGLCENPDLPTIEASIENQICSGTSVTLSIGDAQLNDALTWEWYSESCGGTYIGNGTSIEVSPSMTTTYFVRGEGACSSSTTCSFVTIEVYDLCPEASLLAFSLPQETAPAVIDDINFTVSLEVEIGTDLTSLTPSVTVSPFASYTPLGAQNFTNTVVYTVTAEDGTTTQDWDVTITEAPNASPTVDNSLEDASEVEGFGSIQINYSNVFSDADGHALAISVISSDENVATAEVISSSELELSEVGIGSTTITLTADDGFGGSAQVSFTFTVNSTPLGLDETDVKVYPNPTSDFVHVESMHEVSVRLIDLNGKVIQMKNGSRLSLDIQSLQSGMYLLQITDGKETRSKRIIKTN